MLRIWSFNQRIIFINKSNQTKMKKLILLSLMAFAIQTQAQNVGIGTTTPTLKLHVHEASGSDASIGITNTTTTDGVLKGARLRMVNSDFIISNNETTGKLSLATNFNHRLTIASNGKVGIGVDPASAALLEVNGDTKINGEVNRPTTGAANMVPIAYGMIDAAGVVQNGSGNFTVTRGPGGGGVNANTYIITITNETYYYQDYTTSATVSSTGPKFISVNSLGGNTLSVYIYDITGTQISSDFTFVTYKP